MISNKITEYFDLRWYWPLYVAGGTWLACLIPTEYMQVYPDVFGSLDKFVLPSIRGHANCIYGADKILAERLLVLAWILGGFGVFANAILLFPWTEYYQAMNDRVDKYCDKRFRGQIEADAKKTLVKFSFWCFLILTLCIQLSEFSSRNLKYQCVNNWDDSLVSQFAIIMATYTFAVMTLCYWLGAFVQNFVRSKEGV